MLVKALRLATDRHLVPAAILEQQEESGLVMMWLLVSMYDFIRKTIIMMI